MLFKQCSNLECVGPKFTTRMEIKTFKFKTSNFTKELKH